MVRNTSGCITYCLEVACTQNRPSDPHLEVQESARCKYKTCHAGVNKSLYPASAGDYCSRCRDLLSLQFPLPLSLIPFCSSGLQWICNDRTGFCIRDGGRQVFMTAGRSGSDSNAGCGVGYSATH